MNPGDSNTNLISSAALVNALIVAAMMSLLAWSIYTSHTIVVEVHVIDIKLKTVEEEIKTLKSLHPLQKRD